MDVAGCGGGHAAAACGGGGKFLMMHKYRNNCHVSFLLVAISSRMFLTLQRVEEAAAVEVSSACHEACSSQFEPGRRSWRGAPWYVAVPGHTIELFRSAL